MAKVVFVWNGDQENIVRSSRNIPEVFLVNSDSLSADVVKANSFIFKRCNIESSRKVF